MQNYIHLHGHYLSIRVLSEKEVGALYENNLSSQVFLSYAWLYVDYLNKLIS